MIKMLINLGEGVVNMLMHMKEGREKSVNKWRGMVNM